MGAGVRLGGRPGPDRLAVGVFALSERASGYGLSGGAVHDGGLGQSRGPAARAQDGGVVAEPGAAPASAAAGGDGGRARRGQANREAGGRTDGYLDLPGLAARALGSP